MSLFLTLLTSIAHHTFAASVICWWLFLWANRFVSGLLLYPFHGTFLYNLWLRAMGAKVGKGSIVDPGPSGLFEIDNITVGNNSILLSPNIHGHFVDHGKLQFATVEIGDNVRINDGATVSTCSYLLCPLMYYTHDSVLTYSVISNTYRSCRIQRLAMILRC